ncbi:PEP/pyruvate-binding domain-containing protein [Neisseria sp. Ec49-e6-T10]|uniref:PEP/pyruvate-binding domain-containing protein n=1 Tax=Neisseria sp. Ec49-e6-T10 TaxID=3140744 RepID=UPI003EC01852
MSVSFNQLFGIILICFFSIQTTTAQSARKPSYYENRKQQRLIAPNERTTQSKPTIHNNKLNFLNQLKTETQFHQLARVYQVGTVFEIPHVLFVIDRHKNNQIYYINTPKYQLHETFIQKRLNKQLDRRAINENYELPQRRFIFGTLSWQNAYQGYTYEFWEGDQLTPSLLHTAQKQVQQSFFAPVIFKTNSTKHEQLAKENNIAYITQAKLIGEQPLMVLNTGKAAGTLKVIYSDEELNQVTPNDIVILKDVPISLPPVAAVITEQPSTILSHVNLLTKNWGVPNIYLKNAQQILQTYIGKPITLNVRSNQYEILPYQQIKQTKPISPPINLPRPNLSHTQLKTLHQLRKQDSTICGSKAANLGEIKHYLPKVIIPNGFCIPFAQYHQFMQKNGLKQILSQLEKREDFQNNPKIRQQELAKLRALIITWPIDQDLKNTWQTQWQNQLNKTGVFIRSSSNSEDLPHFSGAGLYTTIANVKTDIQFEQAIKEVWASVFNYEAYEARRVAHLPTDSVMMSILIQEAVDSDYSGVMITQDPFNSSNPYATYIVAKKGIGIKVVEGKRLAEQILYSNWSRAIQILSQSEEDSELKLDDQGGVLEQPIQYKQRVLNDQYIIQLAQTGHLIKQIFKGKEQDIEWAIKNDQIIILQARPYITH